MNCYIRKYQQIGYKFYFNNVRSKTTTNEIKYFIIQ